MSISSYAYTLFWPSLVIIAIGILVLFIAWSSDAIGSRKQARVLDQFRAAMRKSLPPSPVANLPDVTPVLLPPFSLLPPLPIANPPPNSVPIPSGPRRSRLPLRRPPLPVPVRPLVSFEEPQECITARLSQAELDRLRRTS
jgi:hypothetical protein